MRPLRLAGCIHVTVKVIAACQQVGGMHTCYSKGYSKQLASRLAGCIHDTVKVIATCQQVGEMHTCYSKGYSKQLANRLAGCIHDTVKVIASNLPAGWRDAYMLQ